LLLIWFAVCIAAEFPPFDQMLGFSVATAPTPSASFSMAIAYAPLLVRKPV
jgi:hypothetical protein